MNSKRSSESGTWSTGSGNPVSYNQPPHESRPACNRAATGAATIIAGAGIGAALMYLLDPDEGRERREHLAERASHAADASGSALGSAWQHVSDAARGTSSRLHDAGASAADHASSLGAATTGWIGSKLHDAHEAMPSRKTVRHNADPRNWFRHEPTWSEKYVPSAGATIGAGTLALATLAAMFFLDPQSGRRRRAMVRDKTVRAANETGTFLRTTGRRLSNRGHGLVHEATDRVTGRHSPASDRQLAARVSAELGHLQTGRSVTVDAEHGTVYLRGTVSPDDAPRLVSAASSVRGVSNVVNFLTVTDNIATGGAASMPSTGASI